MQSPGRIKRLSDEREDLELEALQRKLDDAFNTTRPRRGFEDELWLRMQQRRPFSTRLRDAFGGLVAGFREAPAIPLAMAALVMVVVIGVGVLSSSLSPLTRHESLSGTAGANAPGDAYAQGLPTPALHPGLVESPQPSGVASGPQAPVAAAAPSNVYYGPANLRWTGTFPASLPLPVLSYSEPSPGQAEQSKSAFGSTADVSVVVRAGIPQLPLEPTFVISELNPGVSSGTDPVVAATDFLTAHKLLPSWPNTVVVSDSGGVTRVVFQREFAAPDGSTNYLINWNGDRYGIEVDIAGGRRTATGPLPLSLNAGSYPLIGNDQAAALAISEPPATSAAIRPAPDVNLDHVELVYSLAVAGSRGFYEPAYLFWGTFQYNGQTYVKRVLVPLVAPAYRS
jgi:hypothetical protein